MMLYDFCNNIIIYVILSLIIQNKSDRTASQEKGKHIKSIQAPQLVHEISQPDYDG